MKYFFCRLSLALITLTFVTVPIMGATMNNDAEALTKFISTYESKVAPLYKSSAEASFDAKISGKEKDYKNAADLEFKLERLYTDKNDFKVLDKMVKNNKIKDTDLRRQLTIIYDAYKGSQIDPKKLEEMIKLQSEI